MNIPWVNLTTQHHNLREEINAAIQRVLDKADFILGENVHQLEEEFAAYCGTKYAVGVDNGLSALELSLRAPSPRLQRQPPLRVPRPSSWMWTPKPGPSTPGASRTPSRRAPGP